MKKPAKEKPSITIDEVTPGLAKKFIKQFPKKWKEFRKQIKKCNDKKVN